MEFVLRCNDLKCREQLHERAVVTTCSHVFCIDCAETSGLSRAADLNRTCPACSTQLTNADDVVISCLNPSEDYKTSVLSGLSPAVIMECASRALSFYSYQALQEIIYQEYLAKGLTEKYNTLSQQMDQLIHDANAQIKLLQDKLQGMHLDQESLEKMNHELSEAFREKSKAQQHIQKMYQSLKAKVMASHVANAATDEAEHALHSVRGDRFVDRLPGARFSNSNLTPLLSANQQTSNSRQQNRAESGSSESNGQPRDSLDIASAWNARHPGQRMSGVIQGAQQSTIGTPLQTQNHRSRLPVLGALHQNTASTPNVGPSYQASTVRQPLGSNIGSGNLGRFGIEKHKAGGKYARRGGSGFNVGSLGR